ncbi:MAG: hypothetical protein KDA58_16635 [Planctomycetaceae bacterium]|nr:hypothetical protein [Planctomycetaceae bacterium]
MDWVRLITLICFATHAGLGCAVHRHECCAHDVSIDGHEPRSVCHAHAHACSHHTHRPAEATGDNGCPNEDCPECVCCGQCEYLLDRSISMVETDLPHVVIAITSPAVIGMVGVNPDDASSSRWRCPPPRARMPQRALLQRWLI